MDELKKVQAVAQSYYARRDIQKAIFNFCKNREVVPRYLESFGKRPDSLDYPNDILNYAKKGATSFHCSEELWENPLNIKQDEGIVSRNKNRIGWDFLIDIDSKYFDFAKIAAKLFLKVLSRHGVENVGIKFSGNKGFHMIIPYDAFPKEVNGLSIKDMFPEWPRLVASYLFESIKQDMFDEIISLSSREELESKGEMVSSVICPKCKNPTIKKKVGLYKCQNFKCGSETESMKSNRKEMICPVCNAKMKRVSQREIDFCESCKINTSKFENSFDTYGGRVVKNIKNEHSEFKIDERIDSIEKSIDIVLVSSRHLFRTPYSLHEKTAFASVVIDKEELENFKPSDADPLKIVKIKNFMPECEEGEATRLLLEALERNQTKKNEFKEEKTQKEFNLDIKGLKITEDMFPPEIKKILEGMKTDGRKRGLYLLLSFFNSLGFTQDYIREKVESWNNKNYAPLPSGYVDAQLVWFEKNHPMPPNYDKPIYKEFGINMPPEEGIKNPINYTIKRALKKTKTTKNPKQI